MGCGEQDTRIYTLNGTTLAGHGNLNAQGFKQWKLFTAIMPDTIKQVQFLFSMVSDGFNNFEGLALDDIHIYDSTNAIYDLPQNSEAVTKTINGNAWTPYIPDGKIIASINGNGKMPAIYL
jgi:hypothetical protein